MPPRLRIVPKPEAYSVLALWHLLSLDAPTVAAVWTYFIAVCCEIHLPAATALAMAVTVWVLYASDRLLDTRRWNQWRSAAQLSAASLNALQRSRSGPLPGAMEPSQGLEARHLFHHRHRRLFLAGIVVASLFLVILVPRLDPRAIKINLLLGAFLIGYFILIHATSRVRRLPKEFAVGSFFSAAVFVPTIVRWPEAQRDLVPYALLFGVLCTLNCLFIFSWEHPIGRVSAVARPHLTTRVALRHLDLVAFLLLLLSVDLSASHHLQAPIAVATAISTASLLLLDRVQGRLTAIHLRACADLALLTPLLILPFLLL